MSELRSLSFQPSALSHSALSLSSGEAPSPPTMSTPTDWLDAVLSARGRGALPYRGESKWGVRQHLLDLVQVRRGGNASHARSLPRPLRCMTPRPRSARASWVRGGVGV